MLWKHIRTGGILAAAVVVAPGCAESGFNEPSGPSDAEVAEVIVAPNSYTLQIADTVQLTASALDQSGKPVNGTSVKWSSSDMAVARVNSNGKVSGHGPGSAVITATAAGESGTAQITVPDAPVTNPCSQIDDVVITPGAVTLTSIGATRQLSASAVDAGGDAISGVGMSWTTLNSTIATVGGMGLVTAMNVGTALIVATAAGCAASDTVGVVVDQVVASVTVTPPTASIGEGATVTLQAIAEDSAGHTIPNTDFDWNSTANGVATVNSNGRVTGVAAGTASIIALAGSRSDTTVITVTGGTAPPPPPPSPPPPPGSTSHDFEDGTLGPFTTGGSTVVGQGDSNIFAVDDPTGKFGGKVLQIRYQGSSDVNRSIRLRNFELGPGQTAYVSGRVMIPAGVDLNVMRKLFYFNPASTGDGFVVVRVDGDGSRLFWKTETNDGVMTGGTFTPGQVHHLRVQVTLNQVGQSNGIFRQWVDGQLVFERTNIQLLKANTKYTKWTIGQQAQRWDLGSINEVRYWDDIVFETK